MRSCHAGATFIFMKGGVPVLYVKIESVIDELDECGLTENTEKTEVNRPAEVAEWGNALTLSYSEDTDGGEVRSLVTVNGDTVTVTRTGAIESEFVFREGESRASLYRIPPYSFDAEIYTRKIRNNITRAGGILTVLYDMTLGGTKRCVRMKITLSGGGV